MSEEMIEEQPEVFQVYARPNEKGEVIKIFSTCFFQPQEGDVLLKEGSGDEFAHVGYYKVYDENGFLNYVIKDGALADRDKTADMARMEANMLRSRRKAECFSVINRGALWYEKLTQTQKQELSAWYEAWLDAPATGTAPTAPIWLNEVAGQAKTI